MKKHFLFLIVLVLAACRHDITPDIEKPEQPGIFPDYADATIPPNIAPHYRPADGRRLPPGARGLA